jgi:AraC family ethanolamine operon transcriptional activator
MASDYSISYCLRAIHFAHQNHEMNTVSPRPLALLHRQRNIVDPDQLQDAVSHTGMRIDRLSRSDTPSYVEQFQSSTDWALDIAEYQTKFRAQGPQAQASDGIVFIRKANGTSICGIPLEDGTIILIPAGTTIMANVMPGFSYIGAIVPATVWAASQFTESGIYPDHSSDNVVAHRLPADRLCAINYQLNQLIVRLDTAATTSGTDVDLSVTLNSYLISLAEILANCTDKTEPKRQTMQSHLRQAQLAQNWIHSNIDQPIRISDICSALEISRRQLEYTFRTAFDLSPHEYISTLRLNEIRRALLKYEDMSVTDIALQFGVTHLSRFSARYRDLFGELPSQTRSFKR